MNKEFQMIPKNRFLIKLQNKFKIDVEILLNKYEMMSLEERKVSLNYCSMFLNESVDIVLPIFLLFVNKEGSHHKIELNEILFFITICCKSNDNQKMHYVAKLFNLHADKY